MGDGEGEGVPMDPHVDGSGIPVHPSDDNDDNRSPSRGFLGTAPIPVFPAPRGGVPVDLHGDSRICRTAGRV